MPRRLIHLLHAKDNVATALEELEPGVSVEGQRPPEVAGEAGQPVSVHVRMAIPFGHKVALARISSGQPVVKYGEVIGLACADIEPGEHVHVHNLESQRGRGDLVHRST